MKVDKSVVVDQWGLPFEGADNVKIIADECVGSDHGAEVHELIVEVDEITYRVTYAYGARETPFEYDSVVEFIPVKAVRAVITKWVDCEE